MKAVNMIDTIINRLRSPRLLVPLVLLWLSIAGYFLFVFKLGYYWDDWAFAWISQQIGAEGLARYFSTNRPYWGKIYQLTTALLGSAPWRWQIFSLFWHWLSALSLWWMLRLLWPQDQRAATWISCLFAVYPGYGQQPIAILSGHFFIVITALMLSYAFMLLAIRRPTRFWLYTGLGLLFAFVNLLTMEYFFLLDLLRPLMIWLALDGTESFNHWRQRIFRSLRLWLPYLLLFIAMTIWRAFFFQYQTQNYRPSLLKSIKTDLWGTLGNLLANIAEDIWMVSYHAWKKIIDLPLPALQGPRITLLFWLVAALTLAVLLFAAWQLNTNAKNNPAPSKRFHWGWQAILLGLAAILIAGWPFWLTDIQVGLVFNIDRFTLPFILGVSLLLAGLIRVLPFPWPVRSALLSILVALAVGQHLLNANEYRRDWDRQKSLFWQMTWRMPALEPGTTILSNDWKTRFYSDNSLTSPLNWVYAPQNHTSELSYMFYFTEVRLGRGLKALEKGLPIHQNYLAGSFSGSTSQVVSIYYGQDSCLRVLDAEIEPMNWMLHPEIRLSALISTTDPILAQPPEVRQPPEIIFGPEPAHGWCYYYQKADLARQLEDWKTAAALGDEAFALGDRPNNPAEYVLFIESYAHNERWQEALQWTQTTADVTPHMDLVLCTLWERIEQDLPAAQETAAEAYNMLGCE